MTNMQILALVLSCGVAGTLIIGVLWGAALIISLRGLNPEDWE